MCSVGGPMEVDLAEQVQGKSCICEDCENKFKALGKKIRCPSCGSDQITALE